MNQKWVDFEQAGFLMLLLCLAVDSFKAACASVSKEMCCCCPSLSRDCLKLCRDSGTAQPSVPSQPGSLEESHLQRRSDPSVVRAACSSWKLLCPLADRAALTQTSSFPFHHLYCVFGPAVVLCDSLLPKYTPCTETSHFLSWCLSFG